MSTQERIMMRDQITQDHLELAEVEAVLRDLNAAQAPTLAQRVRDTIEHEKLCTDLVIHDSQKLEHSLKAQITYWMGLALLTASERAEGAS